MSTPTPTPTQHAPVRCDCWGLGRTWLLEATTVCRHGVMPWRLHQVCKCVYVCTFECAYVSKHIIYIIYMPVPVCFGGRGLHVLHRRVFKACGMCTCVMRVCIHLCVLAGICSISITLATHPLIIIPGCYFTRKQWIL